MSDIFEQRQAFNFYRSYYDTSLLLENSADIYLNIDTAVKFCKELKKQIGEAKDIINKDFSK